MISVDTRVQVLLVYRPFILHVGICFHFWFFLQMIYLSLFIYKSFVTFVVKYPVHNLQNITLFVHLLLIQCGSWRESGNPVTIAVELLTYPKEPHGICKPSTHHKSIPENTGHLAKIILRTWMHACVHAGSNIMYSKNLHFPNRYEYLSLLFYNIRVLQHFLHHLSPSHPCIHEYVLLRRYLV